MICNKLQSQYFKQHTSAFFKDVDDFDYIGELLYRSIEDEENEYFNADFRDYFRVDDVVRTLIDYMSFHTAFNLFLETIVIPCKREAHAKNHERKILSSTEKMMLRVSYKRINMLIIQRKITTVEKGSYLLAVCESLNKKGVSIGLIKMILEY